MNPYAGILFGYFTEPSFGCMGMENGGFSIDIRRDGVLTYKTYCYSEIEVTRTLYELSPETIEQIKTIISRAREQIRHFPNDICNGSCDGDMNRFIFNGKKVVDWNIQMHDIEKMEQTCLEYLEEYAEVVRVENTIMELFEEIAGVLSQNNITLDLFDVQFGIPGETAY